MDLKDLNKYDFEEQEAEVVKLVHKIFDIPKTAKKEKKREAEKKREELHEKHLKELEELGIQLEECNICLTNFVKDDMVVTSCKHYYCMPCFKKIQYIEDERISFQCSKCRKIESSTIPTKAQIRNAYLYEEEVPRYSPNSPSYSPTAPNDDDTAPYEDFPSNYSPTSTNSYHPGSPQHTNGYY